MPESAASEASNISVFLEGARPMSFPIGPGFFSVRAPRPFLPCIGEVATLDGVLGSGGDHGGLGDRHSCVGGEVLATLLFTCVNEERKGRVDAL